MTSRREARRTAIDILYQADVTAADPSLVLGEWLDAGRIVSTFTTELVEGVQGHLPEIDLLLEERTEGWTVARMTALDRTILRVAIHELRHRADVPASMTLAVTQTDPATKGDTRTNALKPATLETGVVVQVPLFVEEGDRVKVDTRSGEYIERVKA